jgi:hypothetical protein
MELFKHTPQDHPDYVQLGQALRVITNVVNEINETKRIQENQTKLLQIQQSFVQTTWGVCFPSLSHTHTHTHAFSLILSLVVVVVVLLFNVKDTLELNN